MTHTFVTMEISAEAFDEIASNLKYVGYTHLFDDTGTSMGMEGVVLTRKSSTRVDEIDAQWNKQPGPEPDSFDEKDPRATL